MKHLRTEDESKGLKIHRCKVAHTQNHSIIYFSLSPSSIGIWNILLSSPVYCSQTFDLQHKLWFSEGQHDLLTPLKDDTFMHGAVSVSDVTHLWKIRIVIWKNWQVLGTCSDIYWENMYLKAQFLFLNCGSLYQLWFKFSFLNSEREPSLIFYFIYYLHVIDATLNFPFFLN